MDAGRLGEILIRENALVEHQLEQALAEQRRSGGKLGEILLRLNFVTEIQVVQALAKQLNLAVVPLDPLPEIPDAAKARVSAELAYAHCVLPLELREEERTLVVATTDALKGARLEALRAHARCWILPKLAPRSALLAALERVYGPDETPQRNRPAALTNGRQAHTSRQSKQSSSSEARALARLLVRKGVISAADLHDLFNDLAEPRSERTR